MRDKLNINLDTKQMCEDTIADMIRFMAKLAKSGSKSEIMEQMPHGCEVTVLKSTKTRFIILRSVSKKES